MNTLIMSDVIHWYNKVLEFDEESEDNRYTLEALLNVCLARSISEACDCVVDSGIEYLTEISPDLVFGSPAIKEFEYRISSTPFSFIVSVLSEDGNKMEKVSFSLKTSSRTRMNVIEMVVCQNSDLKGIAITRKASQITDFYEGLTLNSFDVETSDDEHAINDLRRLRL